MKDWFHPTSLVESGCEDGNEPCQRYDAHKVRKTQIGPIVSGIRYPGISLEVREHKACVNPHAQQIDENQTDCGSGLHWPSGGVVFGPSESFGLVKRGSAVVLG